MAIGVSAESVSTPTGTNTQPVGPQVVWAPHNQSHYMPNFVNHLGTGFLGLKLASVSLVGFPSPAQLALADSYFTNK